MAAPYTDEYISNKKAYATIIKSGWDLGSGFDQYSTPSSSCSKSCPKAPFLNLKPTFLFLENRKIIGRILVKSRAKIPAGLNNSSIGLFITNILICIRSCYNLPVFKEKERWFKIQEGGFRARFTTGGTWGGANAVKELAFLVISIFPPFSTITSVISLN